MKEQIQPDPVVEARKAFQEEMVAPYNANRLRSKLTALEITLLKSGTPPVEAFKELMQAASKAINQAASKKDDQGGKEFEDRKQMYQLTIDSFTTPPKPKRTEPTLTAAKQMSAAKI